MYNNSKVGTKLQNQNNFFLKRIIYTNIVVVIIENNFVILYL